MWSAIEKKIESRRNHRLLQPLSTLTVPLVLLIGVVAIAVVFAMLGLGVFSGGRQPGGVIISESSGYAVLPDSAEATRRSDLIVIAEVQEPRDSFWNTPDGERPDISDEELVMHPGVRIFTPHVLQVEEVLKGDAPANVELILTRLGGQVGQDRVIVDDALTFEHGDKVLVFLRDCGQERAESMGSEGFRYVMISRYVVEDGAATAVSVPVPMDEMRSTIDQNKSLVPQAETSC